MKHKWAFKARFRRHAFGWRSQPAVARVKEAVSEIERVAKVDPILAAEGAIELLERLSPALENVDSSSGSIGNAVFGAIGALVPLIAAAKVSRPTREKWLERLWEAYQADQIPYVERLGDHWGELCASKELASEWGSRLLGLVRLAFSPDPNVRGYFHGTTNCLSALLAAERYDELLDLVRMDRFGTWHCRQFAVKALAAQGKVDEAIDCAEKNRALNDSPVAIARVCEQILLDAGRSEEAYERFSHLANGAQTYLATFRAIARKYPKRTAEEILDDLVERSPPENRGKWFAAAKDAGLYGHALMLANRAPCDPKTLTRAARDFRTRQPQFAMQAGLAAVHWLVQGYGYEITSADVWAAYSATIDAARAAGIEAEARELMRALVASAPDSFASGIVSRELLR